MLSAGLNPGAFKPLSRVCFGMLQHFPFGMLSQFRYADFHKAFGIKFESSFVKRNLFCIGSVLDC